MNKKELTLTITDDTGIERCGAGCGMDWSSRDNIALANQKIRDKFGPGVKLEYLDLAKDTSNPRILALKKKVEKEKLSLPVVMVNGQTRISGQFDVRMLLDVVEIERELHPQEARLI